MRRNRVELPFADIGKVAGDSGCRGHHRAYQVGAPTPALTSFKVTIAGRSAALAGSKNIRVHAQAHGAAGFAPVKTSRPKNFIQTFFFRLLLHLLRAGNHHRANMRMNAVSAYHLSRGAKILDTGVGARADKDAIDRQLFDRLAWLQSHVFERTLPRAAFRTENDWRPDRARGP